MTVGTRGVPQRQERARNPVEVRMKLRTTPTQPAAARGDQAARTDDFIDSIDPKGTLAK